MMWSALVRFRDQDQHLFGSKTQEGTWRAEGQVTGEPTQTLALSRIVFLESWRTPTLHEQTRRLRADRKAAKFRVCTAQEIHLLHNEGPALQESWSGSKGTAASVRGRVFPLLRQTYSMLPRVRSIWFRDCGQDLWTMCKGVM